MKLTERLYSVKLTISAETTIMATSPEEAEMVAKGDPDALEQLADDLKYGEIDAFAYAAGPQMEEK